MSSFRQASAVVLSRSGPTQTESSSASVTPGGKRLAFLPAFPPKAAERVHQDRRGQPGRGPTNGLGWVLLGAAVVDPLGPGIRPDEVVLQHRLEVRLLANLLEERQPHLGIVDRDIARPQDGPALPFPVRRPQARRQESKRSARPLEVRDGGPAFAHQVDQRRVERVRRPDAIPQGQPIFLGLLPLGRSFGRRPAAFA